MAGSTPSSKEGAKQPEVCERMRVLIFHKSPENHRMAPDNLTFGKLKLTVRVNSQGLNVLLQTCTF